MGLEMLKITGKIFEILMIIIIILILLVATYSILQVKIQKKDYINFFGYTIFEVITGSMSGSIEIGDVVVVRIIDNNDIEVNDIVVFKEKNAIITHRIIEINEEEIITKGDANNAIDKPIKRDIIFGKVIDTVPKIGIMKKVLISPPVFISIITTLTLFWIIISYNKNDKKTNKTKGKHYA